MAVQLTADPAIAATDGDRLFFEPRTVDQALPVAVSLIGERSTAFGHLDAGVPAAAGGRDLVVRSVACRFSSTCRCRARTTRTLLGPDHPIVVVPPGGSVLVERLHACDPAAVHAARPGPPGDGPPDPRPRMAPPWRGGSLGGAAAYSSRPRDRALRLPVPGARAMAPGERRLGRDLGGRTRICGRGPLGADVRRPVPAHAGGGCGNGAGWLSPVSDLVRAAGHAHRHPAMGRPRTSTSSTRWRQPWDSRSRCSRAS